jgi:uncharacterized membrane protein HdeD (DUF308 family)
MAEREATCSSCGSTVIDRERATARLASHLRQRGASADEAERRAAELLGIVGEGAPLGLFGFPAAGALVDNWWLFALRGVLAIIFGALTIWQPLAALGVFVLVFGVWAFIDGISALGLAITGWRSWQMVLVGLVGIAVGLLTFFRPEITALGLYATIAAWAIARGILELAVAIQLRRVVRDEVWLVLGGLASIFFGVLLIVLPVAGLLALAWLIGVYAWTFGIIMCVLASRLRSARRPTTPEVTAPVAPSAPQPA